ncbi:hypothetical protein BDN70DRAFT_409339 [Pholiota conissans]|uniref:Heterokaryon incompatibility domain-containing protein n=1 Tax=Pholiota conissans TaxID=109636 RepID=A0A9P5Z7N6_9AGAR|nr:hypothetical protein BDN70DRAFT_409339 [Pholiota conissans]
MPMHQNSDRHPRRRSRSRTGAKVRDHKVVANPAGAVVTKSRLYPELEKLLEEQMKKRVKRNIPEELISALREHVSNNMPRRLVKLGTNPGELKLVSGNELVQHILAKMRRIDQDFLDLLERKVSDLENDTVRASSSPSVDDSEEDVRENVWGAICDFLIPKFARYAILSHTWLQTDPEINYQDAIDYEDWLDADGEVSDSDKKPGYAKFKSFCDVAYDKYDLSLAWCDTICINKESSAELDEAIQSMYKWYQNSFVCITYLSETDHIGNMKKDKWFKRGWTLQELIASPRIHFYKKKWTRLSEDDVPNDKAYPMIQEIISKKTNIEPGELVSFDPLNGSDVSTRMTWAVRRETTRGEDKAYSLMGIFGVNFPISYGEGSLVTRPSKRGNRPLEESSIEGLVFLRPVFMMNFKSSTFDSGHHRQTVVISLYGTDSVRKVAVRAAGLRAHCFRHTLSLNHTTAVFPPKQNVRFRVDSPNKPLGRSLPLRLTLGMSDCIGGDIEVIA